MQLTAQASSARVTCNRMGNRSPGKCRFLRTAGCTPARPRPTVAGPLQARLPARGGTFPLGGVSLSLHSYLLG